ncbi:SWAP/Surp superfamily [Arabidopsis thaliana x Arabidopsis arenosa]|uniref:SWAP/Surp superfamily n=1 Tax=Arabidopsis thaliana x Arabidopsis arenosa TaxID=1240361 RepID=A0A8T2AYW2_9BRAS|nr:SWAP/Surp superfamily [Arabidopsis thaliana x Arabidopsis arenosa]
MKQVPENRIFVETIARLVSQKGLELERTLMSIDTNFNGENYRFLCNSDPSHVFYKQTLNEYLNSKNQEDGDYEEEADFPSPPSRYRDLSFRSPNSITRKDLNIIKLTAQFVARYGMYFVQGLREKVANKPQFEFLKPMDIRFSFYNGIVRAYSTVLRPCSDEIMMMISVAFVGVFEVFFNRLQLEKLEEGDVMAMIDLHAFVSGVDSFAYMDDQDFHDAISEPERISLMLQFSEMKPLGSNQLTTTTTTQGCDQSRCSRAYRLFEKRVTLKELGIIKLTAQFVARYGPRFRRDLMERVAMNPLFEFLKPTDNRSRFFNFIEYAYSRVLLPSDHLWNSVDGCTGAVLEFFSKCLQLEKLEDGVEMATVDLHAFVGGLDCFTHLNDRTYSYIPPPERLSTFMRSQLCNPQNHQVCVQEPVLGPIRLDDTKSRFTAKGITTKELGIIMLTAQFVARYGFHFGRDLRKRVVMNRQFGFMQRADRRHEFYRGLVNAYYLVLRPSTQRDERDPCTATFLETFFDILRVMKLEEEEEEGGSLHAFVGVVDCFARMDDEEYSVVMPPTLLRPPGMPPPKRSPAADIHDYCVDLDNPEPHPFRDHRLRPTSNQSHSMLCLTHKELCVIKVTAQFEARYGMDFMRALMTKVAEKTPQQFEFMEATSGRRFDFYSQLVESYSRILMPCKKLDADTVLEGFFHLVDCFQQEGVDFPMGLVDAVDCFAHMNGVINPLHNNNITLVYTGQAYVQCPPPSMQPEPKRRRTVSGEIHSEGDTGY